MYSIQLENVSKKYKDFYAVDEVTFSILKGKIVGIVGANGSGKTTLMEMMMGIKNPTEGKIKILDLDLKRNSNEIKNKIGVLLQEHCVYEDAKVIELFKFFKGLYKEGLDLDKVINIVNLKDYLNFKFKELSGGLKQRALLGLAIINNPDIIFLDEPTTGLDPDARKVIWEALLQFKKENKTIVLSSHYMDEVQKYCDEIIIMKNGKILIKENLSDLMNDYKNLKLLEDVYFEVVNKKGGLND